MSELADISNNPLNPVSFIKTWEVFDPQVRPESAAAIMRTAESECCRFCRSMRRLG
jgi:hypothetical protein